MQASGLSWKGVVYLALTIRRPAAASNCQKAKDELNNAKTDKAIEQAVIKVRTLCED